MRPTAHLSTEEKLRLLNEIAIAEERFLADYSALLEAFLDDNAPEVRLAAIRLLWEYPEPRFVERLIAKCDDPSFDVRLAALDVLGRHIYEGEASEEPADESPWESITAPLRTASRRTVAFLVCFYRNPDRPLEERRHALEAAAFSRSPEVGALIEEAYHSNDRELQLSAIAAMGHNGDSRWSPIVLREIENPDPNVRIEAVRAAGEMGLKAAVPTLMRYARRTSVPRGLRFWSIFALGQIGTPSALPLLERLSVAPDQEIATTARTALDEWYYVNNESD
ncbi:MAG: HEAT repeat domain-containing protein [Ardenticatenaceae bacterium]|nr:HEAT repeat domain-containing protein [Ardenticatenaceae bacterium]